ncbi:hypothetical protein BV25DRAFT_1922725 [Artomyces pyxidatus]|uniref:Uncharacterized protein n=1 Tax=Artomyces pyxidatus TaxID=48021 RepID=A0ACB8SF50_9AGAM|nr:hypothetical protein BV25DRAFT_1922725 [Artomyces pyxidatus]
MNLSGKSNGASMLGMKRKSEAFTKDSVYCPRKTGRHGLEHSTPRARETREQYREIPTPARMLRPLPATDVDGADLPLNAAMPRTSTPTGTHSSLPPSLSVEKPLESVLESSSLCSSASTDAAITASTPPILQWDMSHGTSAKWECETLDLLRAIGATSVAYLPNLDFWAHSPDETKDSPARWADEALEVLDPIGRTNVTEVDRQNARPLYNIADRLERSHGVSTVYYEMSSPQPVESYPISSSGLSPCRAFYSTTHTSSTAGLSPTPTSSEMSLVGRPAWWSSPIWTRCIAGVRNTAAVARLQDGRTD